MNKEKLKYRHEFKYFISYYQYLILKSRLGQVLKLDPNADSDGDYLIRSLYFDDVYDSALFEKNFGVNIRKKYRIRTYNYSNNTIKLERKFKVGQYVCKQSDKLTKEEYSSIMNNNLNFLIESPGVVKKDFFLNIKNKILRPKVIVDYEREAYISDISDVRITFDKNLRVAYSSNDIFDKNIATQCIVPMPRLILEVKYNEFMPSHIGDLLKINGELTAISKYVFCRTQKNNI